MFQTPRCFGMTCGLQRFAASQTSPICTIAVCSSKTAPAPQPGELHQHVLIDFFAFPVPLAAVESSPATVCKSCSKPHMERYSELQDVPGLPAACKSLRAAAPSGVHHPETVPMWQSSPETVLPLGWDDIGMTNFSVLLATSSEKAASG